MIVGPLLWFRNFLEQEDDPNIPFLGEILRKSVSKDLLTFYDVLKHHMGTRMKTVLFEYIRDTETSFLKSHALSKTYPGQGSPVESDDVLQEESWRYAYGLSLAELDPTYLPLRWVELGLMVGGRDVQRKIYQTSFPPVRFAAIHQSEQFKGVLTTMKKSVYVTYVDLFVELYRLHFLDFERVFIVSGKSWSAEEIVSYFELECKKDTTAFIKEMRSKSEAI